MMFCPSCGHENEGTGATCVACAAPLPSLAPPTAPSGRPLPDPEIGLVGVLPVKTSGWAIAAGYLGLLSPLVIFAPFALALGIVALRHLKKHSGLRGHVRAIVGIVLGGGVLLLLGAALLSPVISP